MNEEKGNPSWPSFLIDLDLAIMEKREKPSRAPNKTGTRAFIADWSAIWRETNVYTRLEIFFLGSLLDLHTLRRAKWGEQGGAKVREMELCGY